MGRAHHSLKRLLLRLFPATTTALLSIRTRRLSHRLVRSWGLREIDDTIIEHFGLRVSSGPFEGLKLPEAARAEHLGPFLLGTYESELHPWLDRIRSVDFSQIIDVGAKFGYYALGLAKWFPAAECLAYDTDPWAQRAMREAVRQNAVRNLRVAGYLRPRQLEALIRPPTLIFSDCEGFEMELFLSTPAGAFERCWLVIELHEAAAPGIGSALLERFASSHRAATVSRTDRKPGDQLVELLGAERAARAVVEARSDQSWMLLEPRG